MDYDIHKAFIWESPFRQIAQDQVNVFGKEASYVFNKIKEPTTRLYKIHMKDFNKNDQYVDVIKLFMDRNSIPYGIKEIDSTLTNKVSGYANYYSIRTSAFQTELDSSNETQSISLFSTSNEFPSLSAEDTAKLGILGISSAADLYDKITDENRISRYVPAYPDLTMVGEFCNKLSELLGFSPVYDDRGNEILDTDGFVCKFEDEDTLNCPGLVRIQLGTEYYIHSLDSNTETLIEAGVRDRIKRETGINYTGNTFGIIMYDISYKNYFYVILLDERSENQKKADALYDEMHDLPKGTTVTLARERLL